MWRAIANWIQLDITSGLLKQNAFSRKALFLKDSRSNYVACKITWNIKISHVTEVFASVV